jgi:uncharacterized protein (DUF2141 family)
MIRVTLILASLGFAVSAQAATLTVRAEGIASAEGFVYVGICDKSFEESTCPRGTRLPARAGTMEFRLTDIQPGRYAIAVYHDRNGNGRLDRSVIGFPQEPYGFSNDIGRTSIPNFQAALIEVRNPSTTVVVPVR